MRRFRTFILIITLPLLFGCSGKGPTKLERIEAFNDAGWSDFDAGSFTSALAEFTDALELDSGNLEARVGAAWVIILLDDRDLNDARILLDSTVTADANWREDAWTALATIGLTEREYSDADSLAALVLASNASYVFTPLPTIDWQDLIIIQAQARYAQMLYDSSWSAVAVLLTGTPHESVDRNTPSTWVFGTEVYAHFPEILARLISYLSEIHRDI